MFSLFYRKYGENKTPLIILHGLFGMSDNWHNIAKILSEHFTVYTLDLRNHGNSPHTAEMNYKVMAEDINNFMLSEEISKAYLLGHSMGGKAAIMFANLYPEKILKMIVVDIAPKKYTKSHIKYIEAMQNINLNANSRKEIEEELSSKISNRDELLFILKNLERDTNNKFRLKLNIDSLEKNYENLISEIEIFNNINVPTLFVKGENSSYISKEDEFFINQKFNSVKFKNIKKAGHWVHAENPLDFLTETLFFLKN
ncbi:MAG: alpha/beta fold hydrolase [Bacteroidia bacterium]|nr:alpha/beta fold hydrolase [Bacteroidia bacterium]